MKRGAYYKIVIDGDDKRGGTLYAPSSVPYPIACDAKEVMDWQSLELELKDGEYCHFHTCNKGANIVSRELKNLFESFAGDVPGKDMEFLPVKVHSEKYGDREYFIMHFKKLYDVIDPLNTVYVEGTDSIIKPCFSVKKVGGMKVFNSITSMNRVFVTKEVRNAILKNHLDMGIELLPIRYSE